MLCRYLPQGAEATNEILKHVFFCREDRETFRLCGKESRQEDDFVTHVSSNNITESVQPIEYDAKQSVTRKSTDADVHQLPPETPSIAWIARQTRPDFAHRISKNVQHVF